MEIHIHAVCCVNSGVSCLFSGSLFSLYPFRITVLNVHLEILFFSYLN